MTKAMTKAEYDAHWLKRIFARCVRTDSGCLVWQGQLTYNGYAQDAYRAKTKSLHRQVFKVVNDVELGRSTDVCHHCDVRNCIEPTHLWAGSRKDNMQDCSAKGRADGQWKTHCLRGHPLSGDNLYIHSPNGLRSCKTCQRGRMRIRQGWSEADAFSMERIPFGYTREGISVSKAAAQAKR